jgi:hypothetical protein
MGVQLQAMVSLLSGFEAPVPIAKNIKKSLGAPETDWTQW